MKKLLTSIMTLVMVAILGAGDGVMAQKTTPNMRNKIEQYAPFELKTDLSVLTDNERELIKIFIDIARVMDEIFWEQSFGLDNRAKLRDLDPDMREFAEIQYGAWDRLDAERPFIPGYGPKPAGANFYPVDMTPQEFDQLEDPLKKSQYTILRRNESGGIDVIPYHKAYAKQLRRVDMLLGKAIELAEDEGLRNYLETRRAAIIRTDDYLKSDLAWMDMKESMLDFVFGPIENYEDGLYGLKTAYEAFVLVKDKRWSEELARFTKMLPELQKQLPCDPKYKQEIPGTESDLNVYDVIYYAGDCNAGGKTIAINLPNDERVHLEKGTRRLQLKNAMQAKFEKIMLPIANLMICPEQIANVKFDAFFSNVCYHEVAHGLGIKNTITGKGSVRQALQNQYSAWEEAKADICGLFIVQTLIERGEITEITIEDAYVTFIAGILRSVRFGATEAHGIANMMCFNYMQEHGAFTRNRNGKYVVNVNKMRKALEGWAALVIEMEGNGDYAAAKKYAEKNGVVRPELAKDLKLIEKANIPLDIRYKQGLEVLGL